MAKKPGKGKRGNGKKPRGRKPTQPDRVLGPRRLTEAEREQAAAGQQAELAAEFEKRKRAQIAKAALELDHVDAAILTHTLNHPGITQEQIGDLVGLTRQTVNERMNAPKFKRALETAARSALEIFEANKSRAARVLGELLGSRDDRIKIRAAIAHMWPHIHQDDRGAAGSDFVGFIQEAFELANATKATADGTTGLKSETEPGKSEGKTG